MIPNYLAITRTCTIVVLLVVIPILNRGAGGEEQGTAGKTAVPAPDFRLITMDGQTVSKASLLGRPTLLMFWAPWCHVCQQELPVLEKFYREQKPHQLQVLSIGFADTRSNVQGYIKANQNTFVFPTAYDEDNLAAKAFRMRATPTFVLLDPEGNISLTHQGGGILFNPQYRKFLATLQSQAD